MTDPNNALFDQDAGQQTIDANTDYHQDEYLEVFRAGLKRRHSSLRMHQCMREDIARIASCFPDPSQATALEALCGAGTHTGKLLEAGFGRVVGVDLSASEIAHARETFAGNDHIEFVVAEIAAYLRSSEKFDVIYLGSLHHIHDPEALLRLAIDRLYPDAWLYVIEPRRVSVIAILARKFDDHLYTLLSSPQLWFSRIGWRLGLARGREAKAWQCAAAAETHASEGLHEDCLVATAEAQGCEIISLAREAFACTRLFQSIYCMLGWTTAFRLLLRKRL